MTKQTKSLKVTAMYLQALGIKSKVVTAKPTTMLKPRKKVEQIGVPDALKALDFQRDSNSNHGHITYKLPFNNCTLYAAETRAPDTYLTYFTLASDPECLFLRGKHTVGAFKTLIDYAYDLDILLSKFKRLE